MGGVGKAGKRARGMRERKERGKAGRREKGWKERKSKRKSIKLRGRKK